MQGSRIFGGDLRTTYGVGDDEDVSLGSSLSGGLGEVADNGGVGVEEVCDRRDQYSDARAFIILKWSSAYHHGSCRACGEHRQG